MRPIFLVMLTACVSRPRYEFRPTLAARLDDAPGGIDGHPAASYSIPGGQVTVATFGVGKLAGHRRAHLRLIVHNGSHGVWTIDVKKQLAFITAADEQVALPTAITGDDTRLAVLMPDDTRTLDLYYALPETVSDGAMIQQIRLDWQISTPSRVLAARETPFERHELPPPPTAPPEPKRRTNQPIPDDDGLPRPGSAEPAVWSSWRD